MNFECDVCNKNFTIKNLGFLGNINDKCNPYQELESLCDKCLITKFEQLLFDNYFDIPINRIKDYKWLVENISIHNYDNSAITQAKVYLKAIVDNVVIRS